MSNDNYLYDYLYDILGTEDLTKFVRDFGDGAEVDLSTFCGCDGAQEGKRVSWCEEHCAKYHSCCNIAYADDIMRELFG